MMSCYSFVSEFTENEEILDYTYYIFEGWEAFEIVNLSDTILIDQHDYYYDLALEFQMFQLIHSQFIWCQTVSNMLRNRIRKNMRKMSDQH